MANTSIYNAFERMWQHVVALVGSSSGGGGGFPTPQFVENDYGVLDEGWYALAVLLPGSNTPFSLGTHYIGAFTNTMSPSNYGYTRILCDGWVFALCPTMGCNVYKADGSGEVVQSFSEAGMKFYAAKLS